MVVCVLTVRLHAPWVHSLKEKRMELKSLLTRLRNTFNVSVAEVDEQDTHTVMVIGVAAYFVIKPTHEMVYGKKNTDQQHG